MEYIGKGDAYSSGVFDYNTAAENNTKKAYSGKISDKAYKELEARGLQVVVSRIQEILTVQEQAGFQMIMAILDEDHIDYLNNKRADAPYWTTLGK